jgi:hypothetical protein
MLKDIAHYAGFVAAIILPFFNIPLIYKIIKRGSSEDISLVWVLGVWGCIMIMSPSAFHSPDPIFRVFSYFNVVLFTAVMITTLRYRNGKKHG